MHSAVFDARRQPRASILVLMDPHAAWAAAAIAQSGLIEQNETVGTIMMQ